MAKNLRRNRNLTEEEKKKIAEDLIRGYKKMAALNQKLAEDGFVKEYNENNEDETK